MKIRIEDAIMHPAMRYRPEFSVPVWVLRKPMMVGLKKPPRLPVQLTSAMPAAAALPPRNDVGSAQNIGTAVTTPTTASIRPNMASGVLLPACVHSSEADGGGKTWDR